MCLYIQAQDMTSQLGSPQYLPCAPGSDRLGCASKFPACMGDTTSLPHGGCATRQLVVSSLLGHRQ